MADRLLIEEHITLAPFTTLGIGGPARFFLRAQTEQQVREGFAFAERLGIPVFILGGGSNVVISDDGFEGLVLQPDLRGVYPSSDDGSGRITVSSGEDWDGFVELCVAGNLAGVECLSGIPGSVGGTPVQNVGAYGQEVSETIIAVRCFDRSSLEIVELNNDDCGFSYRRSIFNSSARDRFVVLSVTYSMLPGGTPKVVYKDLVDHFHGAEATLGDVRNAVLEVRRSKSMVIDEGDPNSRSAGSFFKNPIVSVERFEKIVEEFGDSVPNFPAGHEVKVPAAWLIEKSGFHKGYRLGSVGISTRHTLALVNCGGATAAELLVLMQTIRDGVQSRFGIELEPEPIFIGF